MYVCFLNSEDPKPKGYLQEELEDLLPVRIQ